MTQIYDVNGEERTAAWLAQNYDGCMILPAPTAGATEVWRLEAVYVTEGPATLKVETRNGSIPVINQPVAITWPSLENPSADLYELMESPYNWSARAAVGRTGPDAVYGAGMGSAFGPLYSAWVISAAPSDCLTKTGMKGGTNHRGPLHGVWVLQSLTPVPPDDDVAVKLAAIQADLRVLMQHLGAL